jgi:CRISPR-associated protein Cas2
MIVLVTYDVCTEDGAGRRRLRRVAGVCLDYGQRVQLSVFECMVGEKELVLLRARLLGEMDPEKDSIRLYFLDEAARKRTEHHGISKPMDLEGPLVV